MSPALSLRWKALLAAFVDYWPNQQLPWTNQQPSTTPDPSTPSHNEQHMRECSDSFKSFFPFAFYQYAVVSTLKFSFSSSFSSTWYCISMWMLLTFSILHLPISFCQYVYKNACDLLKHNPLFPCTSTWYPSSMWMLATCSNIAFLLLSTSRIVQKGVLVNQESRSNHATSRSIQVTCSKFSISVAFYQYDVCECLWVCKESSASPYTTW